LSKGSLPYDSERLTPAEQYAESQIKKQSCSTCEYMLRHTRSGARLCEANEDVLSVIKGLRYCESYLPVEGKK